MVLFLLFGKFSSSELPLWIADSSLPLTYLDLSFWGLVRSSFLFFISCVTFSRFFSEDPIGVFNSICLFVVNGFIFFREAGC